MDRKSYGGHQRVPRWIRELDQRWAHYIQGTTHLHGYDGITHCMSLGRARILDMDLLLFMGGVFGFMNWSRSGQSAIEYLGLSISRRDVLMSPSVWTLVKATAIAAVKWIRIPLSVSMTLEERPLHKQI